MYTPLFLVTPRLQSPAQPRSPPPSQAADLSMYLLFPMLGAASWIQL